LQFERNPLGKRIHQIVSYGSCVSSAGGRFGEPCPRIHRHAGKDPVDELVLVPHLEVPAHGSQHAWRRKHGLHPLHLGLVRRGRIEIRFLVRLRLRSQDSRQEPVDQRIAVD
jgi:hypothetical protein